MKRKIKLVADVAHNGGMYVFAYEDSLQDDSPTGFIYKNDTIDGERRDRDRPIGSIGNHCPYLFDHEPTTVFTPEELERIANLPVYKPNE